MLTQKCCTHKAIQPPVMPPFHQSLHKLGKADVTCLPVPCFWMEDNLTGNTHNHGNKGGIWSEVTTEQQTTGVQ